MAQQELDSRLLDLREYVGAKGIYNLIERHHPEAEEILNVGSFWGRDYFFLEAKGFHVENVDIAEQEQIPVTLADVTKELPFTDKKFDSVIAAELLEHLPEDVAALREIQRVLKDDGILIVTVPFFSDKPDYHFRIHSDKTIRRLLRGSGFEPVELVYRGGPVIRLAPLGLTFTAKILRRFGLSLQKFLAAVDLQLGKVPALGRYLFRGRYHGCWVAARKSRAVDFNQVNIEEFRSAR